MITAETVETIAKRINGLSLNETVISELRKEYSDIHFTYCMDDDVSGQLPVLEGDGFNLYLIDGREHCLCLTQNYQNATGIVVAEIIED